jgi:hypothetical protein
LFKEIEQCWSVRLDIGGFQVPQSVAEVVRIQLDATSEASEFDCPVWNGHQTGEWVKDDLAGVRVSPDDSVNDVEL